MIWRAFALTLVLAAPARAETPEAVMGAHAWVDAHTQAALTWHHVDSVDIAPGGVIVVDPLTYGAGLDWPFIDVPAGSAGFLIAKDAKTGTVSKAMLVFAHGHVVCGRDEATVGVDTGLAAFLDRPRADALFADAAALGPNANLYDNWLSEVIEDTPLVMHTVALPSGTTLPMMSSGWGDGSYPVASLYDADGRMLALYVDFLGKDEDFNWLLPPECAGVSAS